MSNVIATLELRRVVKKFKQGTQSLEVLKGVDLKVNAGEAVALIGQSGAGKSTLLQIAGLLEQPSGGEILFDEKNALNLLIKNARLCGVILLGLFINIIIFCRILVHWKMLCCHS